MTDKETMCVCGHPDSCHADTKDGNDVGHCQADVDFEIDPERPNCPCEKFTPRYSGQFEPGSMLTGDVGAALNRFAAASISALIEIKQTSKRKG